MILENLKSVQQQLNNFDCTLVAVSKTKPQGYILEAYTAGQRHFGENKVQELCQKQENLPKDIHWHMIGHLQTNKVKFIAPFVHLIHAIDSIKLLKEINKQAVRHNRIINGLLQVHIAEEEAKHGFTYSELNKILLDKELKNYPNINITGLMGMATNSSDTNKIKDEFSQLHTYYKEKSSFENWNTLSMGMSGDYPLALEQGSNMVRIGSAIFGTKN